MPKTNRIFIDQNNTVFYAPTIKKLKERYGLVGRVSKMYIDKLDGSSKHVGYVIGRHLWLTEVATVERKA